MSVGHLSDTVLQFTVFRGPYVQRNQFDLGITR